MFIHNAKSVIKLIFTLFNKCFSYCSPNKILLEEINNQPKLFTYQALDSQESDTEACETLDLAVNKRQTNKQTNKQTNNNNKTVCELSSYLKVFHTSIEVKATGLRIIVSVALHIHA